MSIVCHLKMHSPNYCSWLAVCINYSANFHCKIALINRFKLNFIKTYSKMQKNKLNVNKNNVEYILRLHLGTSRDVTRGDIIMSPLVTVKR